MPGQKGRHGELTARLLLFPERMDTTTREALARRLGRAELELQRAQREADGSPAARTRLDAARNEYRAAEHRAQQVLGARVALEVVEHLSA